MKGKVDRGGKEGGEQERVGKSKMKVDTLVKIVLKLLVGKIKSVKKMMLKGIARGF